MKKFPTDNRKDKARHYLATCALQAGKLDQAVTEFEQVGKLPVLLSLDRVTLRKPVIPGDQLMLEAESVRIRSRIAHMRCRAYVAEEIAAESEVKFMLVDDDQQ